MSYTDGPFTDGQIWTSRRPTWYEPTDEEIAYMEEEERRETEEQERRNREWDEKYDEAYANAKVCPAENCTNKVSLSARMDGTVKESETCPWHSPVWLRMHPDFDALEEEVLAL